MSHHVGVPGTLEGKAGRGSSGDSWSDPNFAEEDRLRWGASQCREDICMGPKALPAPGCYSGCCPMGEVIVISQGDTSNTAGKQTV